MTIDSKDVLIYQIQYLKFIFNLEYIAYIDTYTFDFHVSFVGMVALVVTGGDVPGRLLVEIIKENFETEVCYNVQEYPFPVSLSAGSSWDDGKVTVCGGWSWPTIHSECYSLENGEWRSSNLQTARYSPAASNIGNSIWVTGNGIQMTQKFQITLII